jgi:hypothetical protein
MVIDHVQDLGVRPAGEPPVGDVGLPALVRHLGAKAHERAAGSLLRLGNHEPTPRKDPPDRRHRGTGAVALGEVEGDRVGAGVQPFVRQVLAEVDDFVLEGLRRARRVRQGLTGPR